MCVSKAETPCGYTLMPKKQGNKAERTDIQPLILNRADPYIYRHQDGMYYFTAPVPEYDRIILRCSDTLAGLSQAGEIVVWRKHENGIMSEHIWAPEIHYINGKWYIYFAAGDMDDIWAIRPYVLECQDVDPLTGTWQELGMMQAADSDEFSCVGMLTIDMDDDLLDRNAWKKEKQPVLMTDTEKGVFGPGHNSFVKDETGKEDIMVYHARPYEYIEGNPLYDPNRHAYLMKVEWEGMTPVFRFKHNDISSANY